MENVIILFEEAALTEAEETQETEAVTEVSTDTDTSAASSSGSGSSHTIYWIIGIIIVLILLKKLIGQPTFVRRSLQKHFPGLPFKFYADNDKNDVFGNYSSSAVFEYDVAEAFSKRKDVYKVYNNLYFTTPDFALDNQTVREIKSGTIVQQDVVVLTQYGILMIEVKAYTGQLFVSRGENWLGINDGQQIPVKNATKQNENHINVLKKIANEPDMPVINTVVVPANGAIRIVIPEGSDDYYRNGTAITYIDMLDSYMEKVKKQCTRELSKSEMDHYHKIFVKYMFPSEDIKKAQVLYAQDQANKNN